MEPEVRVHAARSVTEGRVALLLDFATSERPATIALSRLIMDSASEAEARHALRQAVELSSGPAARNRLEALQDLWDENPHAYATVKTTLTRLDDPSAATPRRFGVDDWARAFDRVVGVNPEASVALYSLGSPDLLREATREVCGWMEALGVLGSDRDGLDLGCGIGRFLEVLSPRLRGIIGLDVSAGMVDEARRRCAGLANVSINQVGSEPFAAVETRSLDLVLAADVMPYLVEVGEPFVRRQMADVARVLRRGGAFLILNYSYAPGDDTASTVAHAARDTSLVLEAAPDRPFKTWDATAYLLRQHG